MLPKKFYSNGQKAYQIKGTTLTYYYEDGTRRAYGPYKNKLMEGKWTFFRKTGQLWAISHFKNSKKHGVWVRYDRNDRLEYEETFVQGKAVPKAKKGKAKSVRRPSRKKKSGKKKR